MKNAFLFSSIVLWILLPVSLAAKPLNDIEFAFGAWQQSPNGYVSYKSDDKIDLQDVLSYDKEIRFLGRLKCKLPLMLPNIYLLAAPMKFEEYSVVDDFYDFGDITILPGTDFKSKFVMNQFDIGLYYNIPLPDTRSVKWLNMEMGLNIKIVDAKASVTQDTLFPGVTISESENETAIIPMLYLGICVQPSDRLYFEGEFRGLSYSDNDIYSLIGRLKTDIPGPVFIAGGYRYDTGKSNMFDFNFDTDFYGPFLETGFYF